MRFNPKKILARIGIGLLIFCALVLAVRAVLNWTNGRRMEKVLREYRDKGVALSLRDIEPDCPPGDNAAVEWKAAEALFTIEKGQVKLIRDAVAEIARAGSLDEETRSKLREVISAQGDFFRLIRAASRKSCFKYEEDWSMPSAEMKVPDAVKMIQGMRLLGIDAYLKAGEGRREEALELCRDGMRFLELQLPHPSQLNYLVCIAAVKVLAACQRAIVYGAELDETELAAVVDRLNPELWRAGLAAALDGERVLGLDITLDVIRKQYAEYLEISRSDRVYFWIFNPVLKAEVVWMQGMYDRLRDLTAKPFHEILGREGDFLEPFPKPPWYYRITGMILPNMAATFLKRAVLVAVFDTIRIGAACRIHRMRQGDYPERLEDLVPEILDELPADPFTGGPYIYKRGDEGFIVYSVGSNRRDDGGRETWEITQMIMPGDDDWAWRENRPDPSASARR